MELGTEFGSNVCKSALWERLEGWEVVTAILLIVTVWGIVQLGRMYFMFRTASLNQCHCNTKEADSGPES